MRLLFRALRLLLTNPRVFVVRVGMFAGMFARDPTTSLRTIAALRRQREAIQQAYAVWLENRREIERSGWDVPDGPTLSVIMPVHNTDETLLEEAIQSVIGQTYPRWELCVADDASTKPSIRPLLERHARADDRIRVAYRDTSGHISAASNSAIDLASGEFVVLLDHDDRLEPQALARIAEVIHADASVDFVYSDEDKIDEEGNRSQPFFKPAWSPTLLSTCNYITHLAAIRRSLVLEVGGFRDEMVGSQDHDLFLRVTERARTVAHIPDVLYSWRMTRGSTSRGPSAKPYAVDAARRALEDAIRRRSLPARVKESHLNGIYVVRHRLPEPLSVSLIVLGAGGAWREVLQYREIEVRDAVFLNEAQPDGARVSVAREIEALSGEYLVWLDGSSRPESVESVTAMLEHLQNPHVAVAGGTTRSRNGTVLQAGMTIAGGGQPVYSYAGLSMLPQPNFYLNLKDLPREVSAVYVGCCAMRRDTWRRLGGWDSDLPPTLAMCDLCLRAARQDYSVIYTPLARFRRRRQLDPVPSVGGIPWDWRGYEDPFWNPNMNPAGLDGLPFRRGEAGPARVQRGLYFSVLDRHRFA